MFLQGKESVFDIQWNDEVTYGDVHLRGEKEFSRFNFELAPIERYQQYFKDACEQGHELLKEGSVLPAYDFCLKASHYFNVLDARGAVSVNQRPRVIGDVRSLARACAEAYFKSVTS
jgi:glycyl-tRNA synthetase alpha chain